MSDFNPEKLLAVLTAFEKASNEDGDAVQAVRDILPDLQALILAGQQLQPIAAHGRLTLAQTVTILKSVSESTASASNEILEVLQHIVYSNKDVVLQGTPQEIRAQLMDVMNALQFQDIVSQQVTAIQTLLTTFDETLAPLADEPDEADVKVDIEGAFDATASFDRERVDVDDLDAWIDQAQKEDND